MIVDNGGGLLAPAAESTVDVSVDVAAAVADVSGDRCQLRFSNPAAPDNTITQEIQLTVLRPGTLHVFPAAELSASGTAGGALVPSSISYRVVNAGDTELAYELTASDAWLLLPDSATGALAPGEARDIEVAVSALELAPDIYHGTLTFTNLTTGAGTTTRVITAAAATPATGTEMLLVSPATGYEPTIEQDTDEVMPETMSYVLSNSGNSDLQFAMSGVPQWLVVTPMTGTIVAGGQQAVSLSLDFDFAPWQDPGTYQATLAFENTSSGSGSTSRLISLVIREHGELTVVPDHPLRFTRSSGGPPEPSVQRVTLANTGESDLDFLVSLQAPWISVSPSTGTLAPGARINVDVSPTAAALDLVSQTSMGILFDTTSPFIHSTISTVEMQFDGLVSSVAVVLPDHGTNDAFYTYAQRSFLRAISALPADGSLELSLLYWSSSAVPVQALQPTLLTPETVVDIIDAFSKPWNPTRSATPYRWSGPTYVHEFVPDSTIASPLQEDIFGAGLAVGGETLVIAAPGKSNIQNIGTAYVFVRQPVLPRIPVLPVEEDGVVDLADPESYQPIDIDNPASFVPVNLADPTTFVPVAREDDTTFEWIHQATLTPAQDGSRGTRFGSAVGISDDGNTIVVGRNGHDEAAGQFAETVGAAFVYMRQPTLDGVPVNPLVPTSFTWVQQQKLFADLPRDGDDFASAVAIDGDVIAVGAPYAGGQQYFSDGGEVYIYERNPGDGIWALQLVGVTRDQPDEYGEVFSALGEAVVVSGDLVLAGNPLGDRVVVDGGVVQIWWRDAAGAWHGQPPLYAETGAIEGFGSSLSFDGDILVVGAPKADDGAGAVYVYKYDGVVGSFTRLARLVALFGDAGDAMGTAVSVDGNTILAGSPRDNNRVGSAQVFRSDRSRREWRQVSTVAAPGGAANQGFGSAVAVDGPSVLIGATKHDFGGLQGAAREFAVTRSPIALAADWLSDSPAPLKEICFVDDAIPPLGEGGDLSLDVLFARYVAAITPIDVGLVTDEEREFWTGLASNPPVVVADSVEHLDQIVAGKLGAVLEDGVTLDLQPHPLSFGSFLPNDRSIFETRPLTVRNTGSHATEIVDMIIEGQDSRSYFVFEINGQEPAYPLLLPAGAQAEISVTLWPNTAVPADDSHDATLSVLATNEAGTYSTFHATLQASLSPTTMEVDILDAAAAIREFTPSDQALGHDGAVVGETLFGTISADGPARRVGMCADGNAILLLRATTNRANAKLRFRIVNTAATDATLAVLNGDTVTAIDDHVTVATHEVGFDLWQGTALLLAGDDFRGANNVSQSSFVVEICVEDDPQPGVCNSAVDPVQVTVLERRAPVVLVHGLWASSASFINEDMPSVAMWTALAAAGYTTRVVDYGNGGNRGPSTEMPPASRLLVDAIDEACDYEIEQRGLACTRVSLVAHSMGGLMSREYIRSNQFYRSEYNFMAGNVRRLITLATPHLGSQFANLLWWFAATPNEHALINDCVSAESQTVHEAALLRILSALELVGKNPSESGVLDLRINSAFLQVLNANLSNPNRNFVPAHAVIGDVGTQLLLPGSIAGVGTSSALDALVGCSHEDLFGGENSDSIVAVSSQAGHISETTTLYGSQHVGMGTSPIVINTVLNLLKASAFDAFDWVPGAARSSPDTVADFTGAAATVSRWQRSYATPTATGPVAASSSARSAEITLSADSLTPAPGDTILFTAELSGLADTALVFLDDGANLIEDDSPPFQWTMTVPRTAAWHKTFKAVALNANGLAISEPIAVTVTPDLTQLRSLAFSPADGVQLRPGRSTQLRVQGRFADGLQRYLTASALGTSYSYQPLPSAARDGELVVTVDADGRLTAMAPGVADVVASNGAHTATVRIVVAPVAPDDADGDGLLDSDEAAAGTNPFMVDSDGDGSPADLEVGLDSAAPRNFDGIGAIDGLDPAVTTVRDASGAVVAAHASSGEFCGSYLRPVADYPTLPAVLQHVNPPASLIGFRICGTSAGQTVEVTFAFPTLPDGANAYLTHGRSAAARTDDWDLWPAVTFAGNHVTLQLTDNGPGDINPGDGIDFAAGGPAVKPVLEIGVSAVTVLESDGSASVPVTLTGSAQAPLTVTYTTVEGTATPDADYLPVTASLSWAAGETGVKEIIIPIHDDAIVEGRESLAVTLLDVGIAEVGQASAAVTIEDDDWLFTLTDGQNALQLGMRTDASDAFDNSIDAPALGSAVALSNQASRYQQDIRSPSPQNQWLLITTPVGAPLVLQWTPAVVAAGQYLSIYEVDSQGAVIGGAGQELSVAGQLEIAAGDERYFAIRFAGSARVVLPLQSGWNLLSFPFAPVAPGVDDVLADRTLGSLVWGWSGSGFRVPTQVEALTGYFVHAETAALLVVDGVPVRPNDLGQTIVVAPHGWNLVGPAHAIDAVGRLPFFRGVWGWNGQRLEPVTVMEVGRAYWGYIINAGTPLQLSP